MNRIHKIYKMNRIYRMYKMNKIYKMDKMNKMNKIKIKIKYKIHRMKKNPNFQQSIQQVAAVHLMNMKMVFMMKCPILMEKMMEIK